MTRMLCALCPPTIWATSLEFCRDRPEPFADNMCRACESKDQTLKKIRTLHSTDKKDRWGWFFSFQGQIFLFLRMAAPNDSDRWTRAPLKTATSLNKGAKLPKVHFSYAIIVFGDDELKRSKCCDRKAKIAFRTSKCYNRYGKKQRENSKCYYR